MIPSVKDCAYIDTNPTDCQTVSIGCELCKTMARRASEINALSSRLDFKIMGDFSRLAQHDGS